MDMLRHCEKEEAQNRDGKIEGSSMSILSKSSRRMKKEANERVEGRISRAAEWPTALRERERLVEYKH
eukprot:scaffold5247_cov158-Skeletonema_marinoi.AAC.4